MRLISVSLFSFFCAVMIVMSFGIADAGQPVTFFPAVSFEQNSGTCGTPVCPTERPPVAVADRRRRRKRPPFRSPLRRLRKRLRQLKREYRRFLKKQRIRELPASDDALIHGKPTAGHEPADVSEAAEISEEAAVCPKRGKPATVPADHVFCPHESCRGYCVPGPHTDHYITGAGTYTVRGDERRQMFKCGWCHKTFSETRGTVFCGLNTPSETVYRALATLAEGTGIRAAARIFEVDKDTVLRWLRRAGEHCEQVSAYLMQNLQVEHAQLDELWTFVLKKEKNLSVWEKLRGEYGDTWIWTAVDPVHKPVMAFHVGDHEMKDAESFLEKFRAVLLEGCMPLLTGDQLPHYVGAILKVFGRLIQPERKGSRGPFPKPHSEPTEDLQYATVCKKRKDGRIISIITKVVFGTAEAVQTRLKALGMKINTSFVERMNLTLRHKVSRLRRKGLTFSKKREYLEKHLHLSVAYYHFVLPHRSLRRKLPEPVPTKGNGSSKIWEYRTPAMSAGLTDRIWTIKELLTFRVPGGCTTSG